MLLLGRHISYVDSDILTSHDAMLNSIYLFYRNSRPLKRPRPKKKQLKSWLKRRLTPKPQNRVRFLIRRYVALKSCVDGNGTQNLRRHKLVDRWVRYELYVCACECVLIYTFYFAFSSPFHSQLLMPKRRPRRLLLMKPKHSRLAKVQPRYVNH